MDAFLLIGLLVLLVIFFATAIKIVREYERGVIFRLGRLVGAKGPGIFILIPIIDQMVKVSLRVVTIEIPPQQVITRDNVPAEVNAVLFFRVLDPAKAIVDVDDVYEATFQISQTSLRSVLGQVDLDGLLEKRDHLNIQLQDIIDSHVEPWGVKVQSIGIKDVRIPQAMHRIIAAQAEAERERRAKLINAEGEFQASKLLASAAEQLQEHPASIQLRFFQTMLDVTSKTKSTIVFPIPIRLLDGFSPELDRA